MARPLTLAALTVGLAGVPWLAAHRVTTATRGLERFDDPPPRLMKDPEDVGDELDEVVDRLRAAQASFSGLGLAERRRRVRQWLDELGDRTDHACEIRQVATASVRGEWVVPPEVDPTRRLLWVHGGAFEAGSPRSHRSLTTRIAERTRMAVFVVDYRLSPEHTRSEAIADVDAAWELLCAEGPDGPTDTAAVQLIGDSAGGTLALGLSHRTRDAAGRRVPDAVVALAPSTDSTFASPSWRTNADTDAFLGRRFGPLLELPRELLVLGIWALTRIRPDDPRVSPLLDDLSGLPPTLLQASDAEMLRDDSVRYVRRAQAAGSPAQLQVWPAMVHVWQAFPELPEAREALEEVAAFLARHAPQRDRTIA